MSLKGGKKETFNRRGLKLRKSINQVQFSRVNRIFLIRSIHQTICVID